MKRKSLTPTKYSSPLREAQAQATRERIAQAGIAFFTKTGGLEDLTFKAVAEEAGVTEMTVYRHFPTRDALLQALWEVVGARMGVRFPETLPAFHEMNQHLFEGFEKVAPLILAGLTSKQGREIELNLNLKKREAMLKVAQEVNPELTPKRKKQVAALFSLLQSSYAWDTLRTYWGMNPKEISETTGLAIDALITAAKKKEKL